MLYDEARLKHTHLVADIDSIEKRMEWDQLRKLERLQRSIRVVRARLGLVTREA